jgi:hypothetical protein
VDGRLEDYFVAICWKSPAEVGAAAPGRSPGELEVFDLRLEAGAENFGFQRVFEAIAHEGGVIVLDNMSNQLTP